MVLLGNVPLEDLRPGTIVIRFLPVYKESTQEIEYKFQLAPNTSLEKL